MSSPFLLVAGLIILAFALFSYQRTVLRKLGGIALLGATFAAVYFATGSWVAGLVGALAWFMLPWLEILTRIRRIRIPIEKKLRHKTPPSEELFPTLDALSTEVEAEGFSHVDDAGWDSDDHCQFFRLFYHEEERLQASICLNEQDGMAFYYIAISSRLQDGRVVTTWNYPFTYGMKLVPKLIVNRIKNDDPFFEILESHRRFMVFNRVHKEDVLSLTPEEMEQEIQKDLRSQIDHNLSVGVFQRAGDDHIKYSWRGMFFLWWQFLRDLVKL